MRSARVRAGGRPHNLGYSYLLIHDLDGAWRSLTRRYDWTVPFRHPSTTAPCFASRKRSRCAGTLSRAAGKSASTAKAEPDRAVQEATGHLEQAVADIRQAIALGRSRPICTTRLPVCGATAARYDRRWNGPALTYLSEAIQHGHDSAASPRTRPWLRCVTSRSLQPCAGPPFPRKHPNQPPG